MILFAIQECTVTSERSNDSDVFRVKGLFPPHRGSTLRYDMNLSKLDAAQSLGPLEHNRLIMQELSVQIAVSTD